MDWLVKNGHPKWKAVDLDFPLKGWEQYDCVARYVKKGARPAASAKSASPNPVLDAMKQMLGD
jgi:hypothetical protein